MKLSSDKNPDPVPAARFAGRRAEWVVSGVVVAGRPEDAEAIRASLASLPWAEVHYADASGRLVVTLEAAGIDESMSRLKQLQVLPRVLMAELAQYSIDGEEDRDPEPNRRQP